MNHIRKFGVIIYISILNISCQRSFVPSGYYTTTQNVPMMQGKHDSRINFTFGGTHVEGQIEYSPLKNLMVLTNVWKDMGYSNGYVNEAGAGYYKNFENNTEIEVIGLFSYSHQETHVKSSSIKRVFVTSYNVDNAQDFISQYTNYSLQFNVGKRFKKHGMELDFTLKYSRLHYSDFYYLNKEPGYNSLYSYSSSSSSSGGFITNSVYSLDSKNLDLVIPALTFKIGGNNIRYFLQGAVHLDINGDLDKTHEPPFYNAFIISNVLQIRFNILNIRKNKEKDFNYRAID